MNAIKKLKIGRKTAISAVNWASDFKELLPRVYHYFCLRVGNLMDAEDLTAETFERAWYNRGRYRDDLGAVTNWLFGIAHHVLITYYRQNHRESPGHEERRADTSSRPIEDDAAHKEQFERIVCILASWPEREREVFSLKYGAQFTNRSIAESTGLTESNVGTILHRIVTHLREELENENE